MTSGQLRARRGGARRPARRAAQRLRGDPRERIAATSRQRRRQARARCAELAPELAPRRGRVPLGDMGRRALTALIDALADRVRDVRSAAARSLGRLGAAARRRGSSASPPARPARVAAHALLAIGPEALPALRELRTRTRRARRRRSSWSGSSATRPTRGAAEPPRRPRRRGPRRGGRALGRLGRRRRPPPARRARRPAPFVRAAAATRSAGSATEAVPRALELARRDFEPARAAANALAQIDAAALRRRPTRRARAPTCTRPTACWPSAADARGHPRPRGSLVYFAVLNLLYLVFTGVAWRRSPAPAPLDRLDEVVRLAAHAGGLDPAAGLQRGGRHRRERPLAARGCATRSSR